MDTVVCTLIEASYLILVGGPLPTVEPGRVAGLELPRWLAGPMVSAGPGGPVVIAADSGAEHASAAGLHVDHVVGDLDSASPSTLVAARAGGGLVHGHATDKDATDFELAVDLAIALAPNGKETNLTARQVGHGEHGNGRLAAAGLSGPYPRQDQDPQGTGPSVDQESRPHLVVLGPGGGRLDHLLADLLHLGALKLDRFEITARLGAADLVVVRPGRPRSVPVSPGDVVSLLPLHGAVTGTTTTGLRWPLVDADLAAGTTRGVSNEAVGPVTVTISSGTLAVVAPGATAAPVAPRTTPYDPSPRLDEPGPPTPEPS